MLKNDCVPLLQLSRGDVVESIHYGAFAIVTRSGELVASQGNPGTLSFPRSSMKPLQTLAFLERNGDLFYDLTQEEVAIMCASHSGTDRHIDVIKSMHKKIGLGESDLLCGTHWPIDKKTTAEMRARNELPTAYRHNCSGKHSGMLAHAKMRGLSLSDYLSSDHPVQKAILSVVAEMCDLHQEDIQIGVDGCSAPVFALPLQNFAMAIANICDPVDLEPERASACKRITTAMTSSPFFIAGPGRLDTLLMEALGNSVISKSGAEGYQIIGIMPGAFGQGSPALGIAIKMSDGDQGQRAVSAITIYILKSMGLLAEDKLKLLEPFDLRDLYNWRKIPVGKMLPTFTLPKFSW
ncbi:MAG: asparaginase [Anaerolineaceae bacterium]|nr:asparaginase [Anaerolineaceae bacterium]